MTSIRGQRANQAQNSTPWECPGCHRTVRGNGGVSSHSRSCRPLAEKRLADNELLLDRVDSGEYFTSRLRRHMSERSRAEFRASVVRAVERLRARLEP
jgi:hypothetical protein